MKLRNKKTGEIIDVNVKTIEYTNTPQGYPKHKSYNSLAELNDEWEDYEEPEEFWYINECGDVLKYKYDGGCSCPIMEAKAIGNYFETREEAEKAVEKLKALKRLKDKGFRFNGWTIDDGLKISICTNFEGDNIYSESEKEIRDALDLLFGGDND